MEGQEVPGQEESVSTSGVVLEHLVKPKLSGGLKQYFTLVRDPPDPQDPPDHQDLPDLPRRH